MAAEYVIQNIQSTKKAIGKTIHPNDPPNNTHHQQDSQLISELHASLDEIVKMLSIDPPLQKAVDTIHEWIPTFIYMDEYRAFSGSAQLNLVLQRYQKNQQTEEDRTIRLIMEQAGLNLEEEVQKGNQEDREQRMLDMSDASLTLTNEIANRWSQKRYEIRFEADGQHFIMFVKDQDANALVPLEERSKGFSMVLLLRYAFHV